MLTKNLENETTMKSNTLDIHMIIEKDRNVYTCICMLYMYVYVL
jgi:hypothetical protein